MSSARADSAKADGKEIIARRRARGWTRKELAEASGTPISTVGRAERGHWVRVGNLAEIAEALGVQPGDIIRTDACGTRSLGRAANIGPDTNRTSDAAGDRECSFLGTLPARPGLFLGRDDDIRQVKRLLGCGTRSPELSRSHIVLRGWPGVGKTTLAAAIAYDPDVRATFPDGVLWTSLGPTPDVVAALETWSIAIGSDRRLRSATTADAVAHLRGLLQNKRAFLIVDDVWQVEHAVPFLVGGLHCACLLTTRLLDLAISLANQPSDIYTLSVLSEDAGLALLQALAPAVITHDQEAGRLLVRELEGLPLALQVAGRLLQVESQLGWGITHLLSSLREDALLLSAHAPADCAGGGPALTVSALLRKSTDRLSPELRAHFATLGAFAAKPATFDIDALVAVWGTEDPKSFIRELVRRGLLEPIGNGRFQMHAVLASHARALMEEETRPS